MLDVLYLNVGFGKKDQRILFFVFLLAAIAEALHLQLLDVLFAHGVLVLLPLNLLLLCQPFQQQPIPVDLLLVATRTMLVDLFLG